MQQTKSIYLALLFTTLHYFNGSISPHPYTELLFIRHNSNTKILFFDEKSKYNCRILLTQRRYVTKFLFLVTRN